MLCLIPRREKGFQLIKEQDAGRLHPRLFKDQAQVAVALPDPLAGELRTGHADDVHLGLAGERSGKQGLATARRAKQQQSLHRIDVALPHLSHQTAVRIRFQHLTEFFLDICIAGNAVPALFDRLFFHPFNDL